MKSVFCFFCVVEASMWLPNASKCICWIWSETVLDWCRENCSSERNCFWWLNGLKSYTHLICMIFLPKTDSGTIKLLAPGDKSTFFMFTPTWGNDPIWRAHFSDGLVQSPTRNQWYEYAEIFGCVFAWFPEATQESLHHLAASSSRRAGGLGDQKTYLSPV